MKLSRIRALLPLLPEDAPHLSSGNSRTLNRLGSGTTRLGEVEKFAKCLYDPKFGWHFVRAFALTERPLPTDVTDECLRRAYNWEAHGTLDPEMSEVVSMLIPNQDQVYRKNVLEALLLCKDLSIRKIGQLLDIAIEIVWLYDQLFFNVRDRIHESAYIGRIAGQTSRLNELRDNYINENPSLISKRSAVDHGTEVVLDFFYMQNNVRSFDKARSMESAGAILTGVGERVSKWGMAMPGNVLAVNNTATVMKSGLIGGAEGSSKDQMGLMAMSAGRGALDTLTQMQAPDLERRRKLQNIAIAFEEKDKQKKIGDTD